MPGPAMLAAIEASKAALIDLFNSDLFQSDLPYNHCLEWQPGSSFEAGTTNLAEGIAL